MIVVMNDQSSVKADQGWQLSAPLCTGDAGWRKDFDVSFSLECLTDSKGGNAIQREKVAPEAMVSSHLPHTSTNDTDRSSQIIGHSTKGPFGVHLSQDHDIEINIKSYTIMFIKLICLMLRYAQTAFITQSWTLTIFRKRDPTRHLTLE
jgi:hypothetical protein